MSTAGGPRPSKNERRDAAREKAREQRLRQQRRERRNRIGLQVGIGVVVLAIVAIVAVVLVNSIRPPGPGPKNMADDGIVITKGLTAERTDALAAGAKPTQRPAPSGKVAIRTYEDFGCPICGQFEKTNAAYIQTLLQQGNATLQIYPVAILDNNFAGSQYSTRAANAAAAVANYSPDRFYAFHSLLFANQPAEGTTGLTDDQLIGYAKQAKVTNLSAISDAIKNHRFFSWVDASTKRFVGADFPDTNVHSAADIQKLLNQPTAGVGTPMVFVDGKYYTGSVANADQFKSFVLSSGAAFTPTPSASPSASASASSSPSPSPTKK
ncbi:MAG TPA: thioredoxin domain-containing protein [Amnibacterium sp.]|uniref:DsbA family protein n=1 Tax=Amnibacterium sp. TaxID=1872496 RepID=UPI002F923197